MKNQKSKEDIALAFTLALLNSRKGVLGDLDADVMQKFINKGFYMSELFLKKLKNLHFFIEFEIFF